MSTGDLQPPASMKQDLHPPGRSLTQGDADTESYRWLWLSLAVALILGLLVIFALPGLVNQPQPGPVISEQATSAPVAGNTQAASAGVNQAMQEWLQLRARLELENIQRWGEPDWSQAAAAADDGARLLAQRQFTEATASYTRALQTLKRLYGSRDAQLAAALAAGEQALADNAVAVAAAQFERVLMIEPQHAAATRGLARAAVRADVLQAMRTGEQAENNGDMPVAQRAFQQAVSLDGEYQPAADALARVTGRQQDAAFQDAMSRALTALEAGQFNAAGKALAVAAELQPDAAVVNDAQQRLAQGRRQVRLDRLRRQAATQVTAEHWQVAADLYTQVLSIDNSAGFAADGLALARNRLTLHAQFDHYLDQPERIFSPQPLANARHLLAAAGTAPADEPVLAGKIAALQELVTRAGTPVVVNLHSDGETEIAVYHVGRLGRFIDHRLELLPGSYTVVGTRKGYRDVRKVMKVNPGTPSVALRIMCEEPV